MPESLGVAVADCQPEALGAQAANDALLTELHSDGVARVIPLREGATEAELRIFVLCGSNVETRVALGRPSTGKVAEATLSLSDVPFEQRPRVLALAVSELVSGYWSVLAERDATVDLSSASGRAASPVRAPEQTTASHAMLPDAPPGPTPSGAAPAPAPSLTKSEQHPLRATPPPDTPQAGPPRTTSSTRPWTAGVAFASRWFLEDGALFAGGALELRAGILRMGAEALVANADDALGRVSSGLASVKVAALFGVWDEGSWSLRMGPRAALGLAWASGSVGSAAAPGTLASDAVGLYADAAAEAELAFSARNLHTALSLEAGGARGVAAIAGDRRVASTGGFFLGGRLGLHYALK